MSDRETRMMARMRRQDEARRERRDRITTYGLGVVIITFIGARYTNHGKLERACLALLAAFGAYAVGVRCGVFYPRISRRRRGCGALDAVAAAREYHAQVALAAMSAYSESVMRLPEPDSDGEDHDHSHFHAGSISSSDSEDDKNK